MDAIGIDYDKGVGKTRLRVMTPLVWLVAKLNA